MLNKNNNFVVISDCRVVFTLFRPFSPLKHSHERIKLSCMVGDFHPLWGERGGCV